MFKIWNNLWKSQKPFISNTYSLENLTTIFHQTTLQSQPVISRFLKTNKTNHLFFTFGSNPKKVYGYQQQFISTSPFLWNSKNEIITPKLNQYEEAANQGEAKAQYNLAQMYASGRGVVKDDKQAFAWCEKAANQGLAAAQTTLGVMYARGQGIDKNMKQAFAWYEKAANQGEPTAQYNLGMLYVQGRGVIKNEKEAFGWFEKAADQGHAMAQYNLGAIYRDGQGVTKDPRGMNKSCVWIDKLTS